MNKAEYIKHISIVTAIAFLFNTMLPFLAIYDLSQLQASENSQAISPLLGNKVLICTSEGFKWVELKDLRDSAEEPGEKPEPHPQVKCALCYLSINGIKFTAPDAAVAPVYIPNFKYVTSYAPDIPLAGRLFVRAFRTRAPPHSA